MTAYNINIEQFINILIDIKNRGVQLMDLDMIPDENNPKINKLIIHPNEGTVDRKPSFKASEEVDIQDPDGDDIFDLFNKAL